jgi:hypothetical protein
MKKQQEFIAAQPGYFVLSPDEPMKPGDPISGVFKEPVLGWMLDVEPNKVKSRTEDDMPFVFVSPITVDGVTDGVIEKPNGKFEIPKFRMFENEAEVLEHFNKINEWETNEHKKVGG